MFAQTVCPQCGADLSKGSLDGVCARCLLLEGVGTGDLKQASPVSSAAPSLTDMTPDAIAAALPGFEILKFLGSGAMSVVYKARQREIERVVALKILTPEAGADPSFSARFLREAQTLAQLDHPKIVRLHEYGESQGLYYLALQYVPGLDLARETAGKPMPPLRAISIIDDVCQALAYAHDRAYVHRDIKPGNILVEGNTATVADFGLAKLLEGEASQLHALTRLDQGVGTPLYMAPEQRDSEQEVDHRADLYALGVVFYELLTGALPTGNYPALSERVGVGRRFDRFVARALEHAPANRFQTAAEMRAAAQSLHRRPVGVGVKMVASIAGALLLLAGLLYGTVYWSAHLGDPGASSLARTGEHLKTGNLVAWGTNRFRELEELPEALSDAAALTSRGFSGGHCLALRKDGTVIAWGQNTHGQCDVPEELDAAVAVAQGYYHSLALSEEGSVVGWGRNREGQARPPFDLDEVTAISANGVHSMALTKTGKIVAWGFDFFGSLAVPEIEEPIVAVASGLRHRAAATASGKVHVWGSNKYGQRDVPDISSRVVALAAGAYHTVALLDTGELVAWGMDDYGQSEAPEGNDFVSVTAGGNTSGAIRKDRTAVVWGWHSHLAPENLRAVSALTVNWGFGLAWSGTGAPREKRVVAEIPAPETCCEHLSPVLFLEAMPGTDSEMIATATSDHLRIVDVATGEFVGQALELPDPPAHLSSALDRPVLVCTTERGAILITDFESDFRSGNTTTLLEESQVRVSALSPASDWVVGGTAEGNLVLWNRSARKQFRDASSPTDPRSAGIVDIAFLAPELFATASADGTVRFWKLNDVGATELARAPHHSGCGTVSGDIATGEFVATSLVGGIARFSPQPWRRIASWNAHSPGLSGGLDTLLQRKVPDTPVDVAFNETGELFSVSTDDYLRHWSARGELLAEASRPGGAHPAIVVLESARLAVTAEGTLLARWRIARD